MYALHDRADRPKGAGHPARRLLRSAAQIEAEFASDYVEIARLLLTYGRTDVARRRLERVVEKFGNTPAAMESRNLLMSLRISVDGETRPNLA